MRLFLALEPDTAARARLGRLLHQVQAAWSSDSAMLRWVPAENLHVTLHFLGEVDDQGLERLRQALAAPFSIAPFAIELDRVEVAPPHGRPRVLWLTGAASEAARQLHQAAGERIVAAGRRVEPRPFAAHVTLARVPDRLGREAGQLRRSWTAPESLPISWTVDRVTLFRSDLSGPVPRYAPLLTVALA